MHWKMKLDPVFPALDSVVPRQGHVLDLGCGYGMASHWLAACTDRRTFLGVDYDENKIRVAQRTALEHTRITFEAHDILEWEYPPCDTVLLVDVLHYWTPDKQQLILDKVRQALRPGGRLVLRDAARAESGAHRRVHRWEAFATGIGHNKTKEGFAFSDAGGDGGDAAAGGLRAVGDQVWGRAGLKHTVARNGGRAADAPTDEFRRTPRAASSGRSPVRWVRRSGLPPCAIRPTDGTGPVLVEINCMFSMKMGTMGRRASLATK